MNPTHLLPRCVAALGILLVGVVCVAATPQAASSAFQLPDGQQSQALAVSPDGMLVVYAANNRLYLKGTGAPQPIAGTEGLKALRFQPSRRTGDRLRSGRRPINR